jgi:uncharacterized short protein YbdD (DUF466 family)
MTTREMVAEARDRMERIAKVVRRIIGVPDYDLYVEHVRTHHPERTPMCRADFEKSRILDKYSRPGGRCC